jgi:hypothetical protein
VPGRTASDSTSPIHSRAVLSALVSLLSRQWYIMTCMTGRKVPQVFVWRPWQMSLLVLLILFGAYYLLLARTHRIVFSSSPRKVRIVVTMVCLGSLDRPYHYHYPRPLTLSSCACCHDDLIWVKTVAYPCHANHSSVLALLDSNPFPSISFVPMESTS